MDGAWEDLGGGLNSEVRPEPIEPPPMRPPGEMPPCPCCGLADGVSLVESPNGTFDCQECGALFDGTRAEWQRHRERREEAMRRRKRQNEATKLEDMD